MLRAIGMRSRLKPSKGPSQPSHGEAVKRPLSETSAGVGWSAVSVEA